MSAQDPSGDLLDLTGTCTVSLRQDGRSPCLPVGRKGHISYGVQVGQQYLDRFTMRSIPPPDLLRSSFQASLAERDYRPFW
jgi:hypothetical protein